MNPTRFWFLVKGLLDCSRSLGALRRFSTRISSSATDSSMLTVMTFSTATTVTITATLTTLTIATAVTTMTIATTVKIVRIVATVAVVSITTIVTNVGSPSKASRILNYPCPLFCARKPHELDVHRVSDPCPMKAYSRCGSTPSPPFDTPLLRRATPLAPAAARMIPSAGVVPKSLRRLGVGPALNIWIRRWSAITDNPVQLLGLWSLKQFLDTLGNDEGPGGSDG